MIYLDTSALVKLIYDQDESAGLEAWLQTVASVPKLTSEITVVELLRTCRRVDVDALADAEMLLAGVDLVPIDAAIIRTAANLDPAEMRSLDAIHVATGLAVGDDLTAFVAYDRRLMGAAQGARLPAVSPSA